jgi:hypothetical protein
MEERARLATGLGLPAADVRTLRADPLSFSTG